MPKKKKKENPWITANALLNRQMVSAEKSADNALNLITACPHDPAALRYYVAITAEAEEALLAYRKHQRRGHDKAA